MSSQLARTLGPVAPAAGAVVHQLQEGRGIGIINKVRA